MSRLKKGSIISVSDGEGHEQIGKVKGFEKGVVKYCKIDKNGVERNFINKSDRRLVRDVTLDWYSDRFSELGGIITNLKREYDKL